jgi:hypothetical protein
MKITLSIIIAAFGITSLCSAQSPSPAASGAAAADDKAIRPFHFTASKEALADMRKRIAATRWFRKGDGHGCIARRAAREDAETREILGDGLRLAQVRGKAERASATHEWRVASDEDCSPN